MAFNTEEWGGFTTPWISPLYPKPPYYYRDCEFMGVAYEMDEKVLADLIPAPLELLGNKVFSTMIGAVKVITGLGRYTESTILIPAKYKDMKGCFASIFYLDNERAIAAGREIWGIEKKRADVTMSYRQPQNIMRGELVRAGANLMTLSVSLDGPADEAAMADLADLAVVQNIFSLKVIPSPEEGQPPEVAELVHTLCETTKVSGAWMGAASIAFPEKSEFDPVYKYAPTKVLGGYYTIVDMCLHYGKVVYRYDTKNWGKKAEK
jgi:acetoacetate decarboxylase